LNAKKPFGSPEQVLLEQLVSLGCYLLQLNVVESTALSLRVLTPSLTFVLCRSFHHLNSIFPSMNVKQDIMNNKRRKTIKEENLLLILK